MKARPTAEFTRRHLAPRADAAKPDNLTATRLAGCAEQQQRLRAVYLRQPRTSTGGMVGGRVQRRVGRLITSGATCIRF